MNPASKLIKELRLKRALSQKDASRLLGYEQSFLSAIERSLKDVPKKFFVEQLIKKYQLTQDEQNQLIDAIERSNRKLIIPPNSSEKMYDCIYRMNNQISNLSETQLNLIDIALTVKD